MDDLTQATQKPTQTSNLSSPPNRDLFAGIQVGLSWKKLRGGCLFAIGWLLSPLCWWNDLIFNLPVAYGFGYLCHLIAADWLLPGTIVGYWLSNIIGILLMQAGAIEVFQTQTQKRSLKKDLVFGVLSSSIFTAVILALVHFQILELPALFAEQTLNFSALWPISGS